MIFLNTALQLEAKPIIEHFNLEKEIKALPYSLFFSDDITLVISGVGNNQLREALAFAYGYVGAPAHSAWINIGTSAHRSLPLKSVYRVTKVSAKDQDRVQYPFVLPNITTKGASLVTSNEVQKKAPLDALYDMEGFYFFDQCMRFTHSELIQSIKVVSDRGMDQKVFPDKKWVSDCMVSTLSHVRETVSALKKMQALLPKLWEEEVHHWSKGWPFTESEKYKLRNLLSGYHATQGKLPDLESWKRDYMKKDDCILALQGVLSAF